MLNTGIMAKMEFKYNVPIISQNLNKVETIIQIAEVLDHLRNITEEIFKQINKRLESNQSRVKNISERVDSVTDKINQLHGANKATQVFSSSKYPASDVYKEYVSAFCDMKPVQLQRHRVKIKNIASTYEPLEKLQIYHVNVPIDFKELEALGDLPTNIEYLNDLCNYGNNLNNNFASGNRLKIPINNDESGISELGEAPKSISKRSGITKSFTQDYFYAPKIGDVPALDVPMDLPDLPGVAGDLHYDNHLELAIAPSAIITQNIENITDLPQLLKDKCEVKNVLQESIPPPPADIMLTESVVLEETIIPLESLPINKVKTVAQVELSTSTITEVESSKLDLLSVNNERSSLMEAIRNAGGIGKAKLKSIQSVKEQKPASNQGGNFMADLHSKLFMRRKGISGTKYNNEHDPQSTLGRISTMIPPPEPQNDIESTSNEEEDWE